MTTLLLLGPALGLALLVWPTPYEYEDGVIDAGPGIGELVLSFRVRRSRIMGLAEISVEGEPWAPAALVGDQIERARFARARERLLHVR